MNPIYVIGHKNPDNDAIMSAVIGAHFMNQFDPENTYVPVRLGEMPKESSEVLARYGFAEPELLTEITPVEGEAAQRIFLTDHNETTQMVDGWEHAEVVGVIDHHRIANLETPNPIWFINMPIGSSCSVLATLYKRMGYEITPELAGVMLSAIMTDTVIMKSPTCTETDRKLAVELGELCGEDPVAFGKWVFNARGAGDFTPEQMVSRDTKRFDMNGHAVLIGQYETVDKNAALMQSAEILAAMDAYLAREGAETFVMLVTDILEEGSQVFVAGDDSIARRGLEIEPSEQGVWMPGVLSRKKQVAAPLVAKA